MEDDEGQSGHLEVTVNKQMKEATAYANAWRTMF